MVDDLAIQTAVARHQAEMERLRGTYTSMPTLPSQPSTTPRLDGLARLVTPPAPVPTAGQGIPQARQPQPPATPSGHDVAGRTSMPPPPVARAPRARPLPSPMPTPTPEPEPGALRANTRSRSRSPPLRGKHEPSFTPALSEVSEEMRYPSEAPSIISSAGTLYAVPLRARTPPKPIPRAMARAIDSALKAFDPLIPQYASTHDRVFHILGAVFAGDVCKQVEAAMNEANKSLINNEVKLEPEDTEAGVDDTEYIHPIDNLYETHLITPVMKSIEATCRLIIREALDDYQTTPRNRARNPERRRDTWWAEREGVIVLLARESGMGINGRSIGSKAAHDVLSFAVAEWWTPRGIQGVTDRLRTLPLSTTVNVPDDRGARALVLAVGELGREIVDLAWT